MELDLREIAHNMARQWAAQAEFGQSEQGEAAHFAHAAARVLQALSVNQVKRCGEDLIDLIDREVPVAALHKLTNREKPSVAEMRAVARQLAAKRAAPTQLDSVFAWVGELFGLDSAEVAILTIFARWGKFECWRELVRRAPIVVLLERRQNDVDKHLAVEFQIMPHTIKRNATARSSPPD